VSLIEKAQKEAMKQRNKLKESNKTRNEAAKDSQMIVKQF
jgi:hypothetical protein